MQEVRTPRLVRSRSDRKLAGVCGGIGHYLGVDPVIIRIAVVLVTFAGGAGLLAYLAAWILMPEGDDHAPSPSGDAQTLPENTRVAGIVVLGIGAVVLLGGWDRAGSLFLPVLLLGAGIWLLRRPPDGEADLPTVPAASTPAAEPATAWVADDTAWAAPSTLDAPTTTADLDPPPTWPRRRVGPFTLGLVALTAGGLGVAGAAGADIDVEVGLLMCLAVTAAGLVIGAFTGGSRGLIGLAAVLVVSLTAVRTIDVSLIGGVGSRLIEPTDVTGLEDGYRLGIGELQLDLTGIDTSELPRRTEIDVRIGIGEMTIEVPPDVRVEVQAHVSAGSVDLFGRRHDGNGIDVTEVRTAREGAPTIVLDLEGGLGEVNVR